MIRIRLSVFSCLSVHSLVLNKKVYDNLLSRALFPLVVKIAVIYLSL